MKQGERVALHNRDYIYLYKWKRFENFLKKKWERGKKHETLNEFYFINILKMKKRIEITHEEFIRLYNKYNMEMDYDCVEENFIEEGFIGDKWFQLQRQVIEWNEKFYII